MKVSHGAEETIPLGGSTGSRPDPLDPDLLAVEITEQLRPALRVAPDVLGFRIEHSAEGLPVPGAETPKQHRERVWLARQQWKPRPKRGPDSRHRQHQPGLDDHWLDRHPQRRHGSAPPLGSSETRTEDSAPRPVWSGLMQPRSARDADASRSFGHTAA